MHNMNRCTMIGKRGIGRRWIYLRIWSRIGKSSIVYGGDGDVVEVLDFLSVDGAAILFESCAIGLVSIESKVK